MRRHFLYISILTELILHQKVSAYVRTIYDVISDGP